MGRHQVRRRITVRRLIALWIWLALFVAPAYAQTQAVLTLTPLTLSVGESGVVEAYLDCGDLPCAAFALTLTFDPAVLHVDTVQLGETVSTISVMLDQQIDNEQGVLEFSVIAFNGDLGRGDEVIFTLEARGIGVGAIQFIPSSIHVGDLTPLSASFRGGAVSVSAATEATDEPDAFSATPEITETLPPGMLATRPRSLQDGLQYDSIWDGIDFEDSTTPGVVVYRKTVRAERTYRWVFTWCGSKSVPLDRVITPLTVQMRVDGVELSSVLEYSAPNCRGWMTLLSGWEQDRDIVLELVYQLSAAVFDGNRTYAAGEYIQRIRVHVQ